MKSVFKYGAYIVLVLATVFSVLLCLALLSIFLLPDVISLPVYIIFNLYFIFVWIWMVHGELRTKVIYIDMGYDSFNVKGYFGLGPPKTYYFNDVEGYKLSILPAKGTSYEFLYVIAEGKKVIKLSQFYHKNYEELKAAIPEAKIKYLGFEDFSYGRELKEIFV